VIERGESFTKVEGVEAAARADASALAAAAVGPLVAAKRMLEDFVSLKAGDAVAQSGADSLTGQAVVQLAAARGLRSVSVARGNPAGGWAKFAQHMAGVGATLCVSEEAAARHDFARLLADVPAPRLGLNGSGGAAAGAVARALGQGATLVSYGGAAPSGGRASALQAPLALFTQRDLTLRGFSLARAAAAMAKPARDAEAREAVAAAASGSVKLLVAREPMADFKAALPRALAAVSAPRGTVAERTVVFTF